MVEQRPFKPRVAGSRPAGPSIIMQIRKLRVADIPQVAALLQPMWLEHARKSSPLLDYEYIKNYDVEGYIKRTLNNPDQQFFVAEADGQIVGTARAEIEHPEGMYGVSKMMYFDDLVVHKDYRRQGIADELMDVRVKYAKSLGITKCYSKIYKFNNAPQKLARKHGFEDIYSFYYKFLN